METVLICLFITMLMPLVLAGTGGYLRNKQFGKLDINNPRQQAQEATGAASRANAAQQNAWEALALFTAAVVSATVTQADPATATNLAMGFVVFRVLHAVCYIADQAILRSMSMLGALVCVIWLFFLGL